MVWWSICSPRDLYLLAPFLREVLSFCIRKMECRDEFLERKRGWDVWRGLRVEGLAVGGMVEGGGGLRDGF